MENNIQIIGNQDDIIYYNLNKQFSSVKKIIITKEVIINSFENLEFKNLLYKLKSSLPKEYLNTIKEEINIFDEKLKNELYTQIQEALIKLSSNYMDVKLDNYNFMNSISNSKFNITLRTEHFSITNYYAEKGTILSSIKHLIKDYLSFTGNIYRLSRLDNFQIEIYESEEIYKSIYLKKENNSILLASTFGFPKNNPIDYSIGHEFYISKGNDFKFFKNKQTNAILREHNKLLDKEIVTQEKILDNNELVLINEKTSQIDEAIIEAYINSKGQFKINNVSVIEKSLGNYTDNGIILSKSQNMYDRISILSLRDNFTDESVNPKYLLLKNEADVKEFMSDLRICEKVDGIIITKNFYSKFLDRLGKNNNLDIIYLGKQVNKSMDEKFDIENIDVSSSINQNSKDSPFNSIISEQNKEKDELLEKLKNIDLSTPKTQEIDNNPNITQIKDNSEIENVVNNIISSEESSFNSNKPQTNTKMMGEKKSAFDFLMDSAEKQKKANQEKEAGNQTQPESRPEPNPQPAAPEQKALNEYATPQSVTQVKDTRNENISGQFETSSNRKVVVEESIKIEEDIDISKYESVLATEIICEPGTPADAYFADINTINEIQGGKVYFLTLNPEEMQNPNLNYVLPIGLNNPNVKNCFLLIKNSNDFFLIDEDQDVEYFININDIHDVIKQNFIEEMIKKVGIISLICNKKDLDLISDSIDKIRAIRVRDIENEYDLGEVKRKILAFEKRKLIQN